MDPTAAQLAARLNPTPVSFPVPTSDGLFRATGDFGDSIYYRKGDQLYRFATTSLLDQSKLASYGNAGGQASAALSILKNQYGLNWGSLPTYNIGDLNTVAGKIGLNPTGYDNYNQPYYGGAGTLADVQALLGTKPLTTTIAANTQPNTLDLNRALQVQQQVAQTLHATTPTSAGDVSGSAALQHPTPPPPALGSVSGAAGSVAGAQTLINQLIQQQNAANAQAESQMKLLADQSAQQSSTWLSKLVGSQSPTEARNAAWSQTGIVPANYYADQQARIAEVGKLTEEYNATKGAMDAETLQAVDKMATTGSISRQQAAIERKYAPTLNRMSANINSKAAVMEALQGNFNSAQQFVNQAVEDATATAKYNAEMFQTFYTINKDTIDRMDSAYKTAFLGALDAAKTSYAAANEEAKLKGQMVIEAAQHGVDLSSYMSGSLKDMQSAYGSRVTSVVKSSNLTPTQNKNLLSITTKFQADGIVNQAINGYTANQIADSIIANPNSATSQLSSLYLLVKNLDPNSAVREGELALANQTQSYLQRFDTQLARISEGRVIDPQAAKDLAVATKELTTAWTATANRRATQYQSQADTLDVGSQFKEYLDGSGVFGSSGGNSGPQTNYQEGQWYEDDRGTPYMYSGGKLYSIGEAMSTL